MNALFTEFLRWYWALLLASKAIDESTIVLKESGTYVLSELVNALILIDM